MREHSEAVEGMIPISGEMVGEKGKRGRKREERKIEGSVVEARRSERVLSIFRLRRSR
jgi:hypothetical protein